jgi:hypothetical protein
LPNNKRKNPPELWKSNAVFWKNRKMHLGLWADAALWGSSCGFTLQFLFLRHKRFLLQSASPSKIVFQSGKASGSHTDEKIKDNFFCDLAHSS